MSSERGAVERLVLQLRDLRISIERTPLLNVILPRLSLLSWWRPSRLQAPRLQLDHLPGGEHLPKARRTVTSRGLHRG